MIIRKHNDSDINNILELLRLNTPVYFSPNEEKDLKDYLTYHAHNYYVIEINQMLVGCGGINLSDDEKTAKISWDIIHPQYQQKGFGSELIKFRIHKIKEIESVKTISVRTSQFTYKFYQKFGLDIKEIVKDFWDVGFDLYRLECDMKLILDK